MRYIYKTKLRIMEKSLIVHLHVKNIGMENYLDIFLNIFYALKLLIPTFYRGVPVPSLPTY